MNIDKLKIAKQATGLIVGAGVSNIVRITIERNVPVSSRLDTVTVTAGTIALSMMISEATRNYTDAKIDAIAAALKRTPKDTDANPA